MFKTYNFTCMLIALTLMAGCKKEILEKEPLAKVVDANFYKSEEDITQALSAAYDPIGWESNPGGSIYANPFFFGDVVSDDARKGGNGISDIGNFHFLETFTGNGSYPELLLPWQRYYTGIYRANQVITNVPRSEAPQGVKDRIIAEAKFLRAYYHFELVKLYGDVPLITKVLTPEEYSLTRTPKADVYAQIETDLSEAAAVLPHKGVLNNQDGRATKGAAWALLARVQMYQTLANPSKWDQVLTNSELVINSLKYDLEDNYADIHSVSTEHGIESIFEINHSTGIAGAGGTDNSTWAEGNEGTFINIMTRGRSNGGWGFNVPTLDLLAAFQVEKTTANAEDPRLAATIIQNGDMVHGEAYVTDATVYPNTGLYSRKYIEPITSYGLNQSDGPSNIRVIRFADVLLMAAEAANELNNPTLALQYLKRVRDRVDMPEITETDKTLLRTIIWNERRLELALEGHRFFDLVRQDRAATVMKATVEGSNFDEGVHEVFPIPQVEIELSQGRIKQNFGYN